MLFTVKGDDNPEGRQERNNAGDDFTPPLLTILFDVSSNIIPEKEPQTTQPPTQSFNRTSQVLNCSSAINCTITYGGKSCLFLSSLMNQSTQID